MNEPTVRDNFDESINKYMSDITKADENKNTDSENVYTVAVKSLEFLKDKNTSTIQNTSKLMNLIKEKSTNFNKDKQIVLNKLIFRTFSKIVSRSEEFHSLLHQLSGSLRAGHSLEAAQALERLSSHPDVAEQGLLDLLREPKFVLALVEHGEPAVVSFLTEYYTIDVNTKDSEGKTPLLHLLTRPGDGSIQGPLVKLLDLGADPNHADREKMTPLHHSVLARNVAATRTLYEYGGNPSLVNRVWASPIQHALNYSPGPNEAIDFLLIKLLKFTPPSAKPVLIDIPQPSATAQALIIDQYLLSGHSAYESIRTYLKAQNLPDYLTQREKWEINLDFTVAESHSDAREDLSRAISVPLTLNKLRSGMTLLPLSSAAYEATIQGLEQEISTLDHSLNATVDEPSRRKSMALKQEKIDQVKSLRIKKTSNQANIKFGILRNSLKLVNMAATTASATATSMNMISEDSELLFRKALVGATTGLCSVAGVYRNWNEVKSLKAKASQLALTKISLESVQNEIQTFQDELPGGIQKTLASMKLEQLNGKISKIDAELRSLAVRKATTNYSTVGHASALILVAAAAFYNPTTLDTASWLSSVSTFAPEAVGGTYAALKQVSSWSQTATRFLYTTLDRAREAQATYAGKPLEQIKPPLRLNIDPQVAAHLGIPTSSPEQQFRELDSLLTERPEDQSNHDFMRQVLSEAGLDISNYATERKKLILTFLNQ